MIGSSNIYELIIIGAGPAGITSAIYAARKKMNFAVITTSIGGQVTISSEVKNYTGYQYITGEELSSKFQEHLKDYKIDLKMEKAHRVERLDNLFRVRTDGGAYMTKTIIVATGRKPRELKVPGESEFRSRGVTYCATCDAPLFENLNVAVIGGGNAGLEAVLQLVKIAKHVYLIERDAQLKADAVLVDKAKALGKVDIWTSTQIIEVRGIRTVTGIRVQRDGAKSLLPVQGVFVEIGSEPNSELVDFVEKNSWGAIMVNCEAETSVPGLLAAGDVTNIPEKQIVIAAGEGCKATLSAFKYLSELAS